MLPDRLWLKPPCNRLACNRLACNKLDTLVAIVVLELAAMPAQHPLLAGFDSRTSHTEAMAALLPELAVQPVAVLVDLEWADSVLDSAAVPLAKRSWQKPIVAMADTEP